MRHKLAQSVRAGSATGIMVGSRPGRSRSAQFVFWLPLFGVPAYAAKSLLAHRIYVAKIGITIVSAEHVVVFNRAVNDCGFLQPFDGAHVLSHILTDIDNRFSNFNGLPIASEQMLKRAIACLGSSIVFRQIPDTLSETAITNRETENLCGGPAHVREFQLISQMRLQRSDTSGYHRTARLEEQVQPQSMRVRY